MNVTNILTFSDYNNDAKYKFKKYDTFPVYLTR